MTSDPPGKSWYEAGVLHIDVRGLSPPDPMVAILHHLEKIDQNGPVIVHHFCVPVYLYPELAERAWSYEITPGDEDEVRLILRYAP